MPDVILQERTGNGIVILTLNRPEAMNCLNFETIETLQKVIEDANFDMSVRVIIITGAAPPEGKKASFWLYPKFPIREKGAESGLYWFFMFFIAYETWPGFAQEYLHHQL